VDTHTLQDFTLMLTDDVTLSTHDWFSRVTAAFTAIAEDVFATAEAHQSMFGFGCVALTAATTNTRTSTSSSDNTSLPLWPASLMLHRLHWDIFDEHVLDSACSYDEAAAIICQTYSHFGATRVVSTAELVSDAPQAPSTGSIKVHIADNTAVFTLSMTRSSAQLTDIRVAHMLQTIVTLTVHTKQGRSTLWQGAPLRAAVDSLQAFLNKCDVPMKNSLQEQRAPLDSIGTTTTAATAPTAATALSIDIVVPTYRALENIELLRTICSLPLCDACSDTKFIIVVDRPEHTEGVKQALSDLPRVVVVGNPVSHWRCDLIAACT
jgi:hypothetical protein